MTNSEILQGILVLALVGASAGVGYLYSEHRQSDRQLHEQQQVDSLNTQLKIQEATINGVKLHLDSTINAATLSAATQKGKVDTLLNTVIQKTQDPVIRVTLDSLQSAIAQERESLHQIITAQSNLLAIQDSVIKQQDSTISKNNKYNSELAVKIAELNSSNDNKNKLIAIGSGVLGIITYVAIVKK